MQKEVNLTWFFKQSPAEVWDYLTKPELMELWLMKSDFKPIVGHKFSFIHTSKNDCNYQGLTQCEVLEAKPVTRLSYSWQGYTNDGSRTFNSHVVWTLIPKKNGTELRLQHHGFTMMEDVIAHDTGWNTCLKRLEEQLNTITIDSTNA